MALNQTEYNLVQYQSELSMNFIFIPYVELKKHLYLYIQTLKDIYKYTGHRQKPLYFKNRL